MKYAIEDSYGAWWDGSRWGKRTSRACYTPETLPIMLEADWQDDLLLEDGTTYCDIRGNPGAYVREG